VRCHLIATILAPPVSKDKSLGRHDSNLTPPRGGCRGLLVPHPISANQPRTSPYHRWRRVKRQNEHYATIETDRPTGKDQTMADKSPKKTSSKKPGRSVKEKRAAKKSKEASKSAAGSLG
jgi:hypothetical protein